MTRRKRGHSQGLDQLGPTQPWKEKLNMPGATGRRQTVAAKAKISTSQRKTKVTLSDHLFKSDEIKTKDDT